MEMDVIDDDHPGAPSGVTVRGIVASWLLRHGYDGLYSQAGGCACRVDDLAPCGRPQLECRPGDLAPCLCGEHYWHIEERRR